MLWARKRQPEAPAVPAAVVPAALAVAFDDRLFERHFKGLLAAAEDRDGVEAWLDALGEKQRRLAVALSEGRFTAVIDLVFGARRRLGHLADEPALAGAIAGLADDAVPLDARIAATLAATPAGAGASREERRAAAKLRRAAHDLATEILHFRDPVRVPLMSRWVWDRATMSGALRELVAGGEAMRELPLENAPGTYEAARMWVQERIAEQGIFRDVHFWADLVLASAYGHYFRAMTGGTLGADFERGTHPSEQITGLLGIDRILRDASRSG
ncbi:MAG TPA: hypothetical protein VLD36_13625 [Burkholderiales bacterium]|nr:hypothetical protein [Burkholderiales bacterium]